jgi:hypothetical protein
MASKKKNASKLPPQLVELLYQALETEQGGVEVYRTALQCVVNDDLHEEWSKYLEETEEHLETLTDLCRELGLDPTADTPGRQIVRNTGHALVQSMQLALGSHTPEAAQLVAAECVVLAETKDHMNWSLLGRFVDEQGGNSAMLAALARAVERVEDEEDEHLYHSQGWARELWASSLGLEAELPPPEEEADVQSEAEAVEVRQAKH